MGFKFFWSSQKRASYASSDESSVFDSAPTTVSIPTITEEDLDKVTHNAPRPHYATRPLLEETLCLENGEENEKEVKAQHRSQYRYSLRKPSPQSSPQQFSHRKSQPSPSPSSSSHASHTSPPHSSPKIERRKSLGLLLAQKVSWKESRPKSAFFESLKKPPVHTDNSRRQLATPKLLGQSMPHSPETFPPSPTTLVGLEVSPKLPYAVENHRSITNIIEPRQKNIPTFFHARPHLLAFELPVKTDQILKIKIFVSSGGTTVAGTTAGTTDVMALKLKKQKLQNIHELVQVIQFKVGFRLAAVDSSDINLSIFFRNPKLKPIPLQTSAGRSVDASLLMDYILAKDKLYVNAWVAET